MLTEKKVWQDWLLSHYSYHVVDTILTWILGDHVSQLLKLCTTRHLLLLDLVIIVPLNLNDFEVPCEAGELSCIFLSTLLPIDQPTHLDLLILRITTLVGFEWLFQIRIVTVSEAARKGISYYSKWWRRLLYIRTVINWSIELFELHDNCTTIVPCLRTIEILNDFIDEFLLFHRLWDIFQWSPNRSLSSFILHVGDYRTSIATMNFWISCSACWRI